MKHLSKIWAIVILAIVMCCGLMVGCGKPSVNLNDYVEVNQNGYEGYGSVSFSLNYSKLISDNKEYLTDKNLNASLLGEETAQYAAAMIFEMQRPYGLSYESPVNAKNGDKVEVKWEANNAAIKELEKVLEVKCKYKDFTHTFADLEAIKEVDPFESLQINYDGFSGEAKTNCNVIFLKDYSDIRIGVELDKAKDLSNGDKICVSITDFEEKNKELARDYGIVLSQEKKTITVETLPYYPIENPKEAFDFLTEENKAEGKKIVEEAFEHETGVFDIGLVDATYVGSVFLYTESPFDLYTSKNTLVMIYRVKNEKIPNGMYVYARAYDVSFKFNVAEDGSISKEIQSKSFYYMDEDYLYTKLGRLQYCAGVQTIEEVIAHLGKYRDFTNFEKMIATEELEQFCK